MATLNLGTLSRQFPVETASDQIIAAFGRTPAGGSLFLRAEPGSGKTSLVPGLIACQVPSGLVLVTEPRRIAAIGAARFAAGLFQTDLGSGIGYVVRGERRDSAETRVLYVTEGMALALLSNEAFAKTVAVLVIDEFHERHASTDLLLILARRYRELAEHGQEAPRSIFMSATFDERRCHQVFPGSDFIEVPGRMYELETVYRPLSDAGVVSANKASFQPWTEPNFWEHVAGVIRDEMSRLQADVQTRRHLLCFLPGKREIARVAEQLEGFGIATEALHGERPLAQLTESVFGQGLQQRGIVFLATNIAESSITVPGVRTVVDTGLVRQARYHMDSGSLEIFTAKAGRHSLSQRAGRAAREERGRAVRVFSQLDFERRPNETPPEIATSDLSRDLLTLIAVFEAYGLNVPVYESDWKSLPWFEEPPHERLCHGLDIMRLVGALTQDGHLSDVGRQLARLPLSLRMGKTLLESRRSNVFADLLCMVSLLSEGDFLVSANQEASVSLSELHLLLKEALENRTERATEMRRRPGFQRFMDTLRSVSAALQAPVPQSNELVERFSEAMVAPFFLQGFADAIGWVSAENRGIIKHMNGDTYDLAAQLDPGYYIILQSVRLHGASAAKNVRKVVTRSLALGELDLFEAPGDFLKECLQSKREQSFFRASRQICYGKLVLSEDLLSIHDNDFVSALSAWLAAEVPSRLKETNALSAVCNRLRATGHPDCLREADVIQDLPASIWHRLAQWLISCFQSSDTSVRFEIAEIISLEAVFSWCCDGSLQQHMSRLAPLELPLSNGKKAEVLYTDALPTIRGRIQDFFGLKTHPILESRIQPSLVLLAPNGQVAQITSDLASFWNSSYAEVRRAYLGRYPKHYWPDDPKNARPFLTRKQADQAGQHR